MMRAREAGLVIAELPTGPHKAITDVAGVRVGQLLISTSYLLAAQPSAA